MSEMDAIAERLSSLEPYADELGMRTIAADLRFVLSALSAAQGHIDRLAVENAELRAAGNRLAEAAGNVEWQIESGTDRRIELEEAGEAWRAVEDSAYRWRDVLTGPRGGD